MRLRVQVSHFDTVPQRMGCPRYPLRPLSRVFIKEKNKRAKSSALAGLSRNIGSRLSIQSSLSGSILLLPYPTSHPLLTSPSASDDMPISHTRQRVHITWRVKKSIYTDQHRQLITLLREVRIEAGLTQTDLAVRIGKDQTFVSKYEGGGRRLDVLELREICQALGITLEQFVRRLEKALK